MLSRGSWGCKSGIAPASLSAKLAAPAVVVGVGPSTALRLRFDRRWDGHGAMFVLILTLVFVDKKYQMRNGTMQFSRNMNNFFLTYPESRFVSPDAFFFIGVMEWYHVTEHQENMLVTFL